LAGCTREIKANTRLNGVWVDALGYETCSDSRAMAADDWDTALRLAARFQRLGDHKVAIKRAADAVLRPDFYRQLGYDIGAVHSEGIAALKDRFSQSWAKTRRPETEN
jgi:hypothetical protein